MRKAIAVLLAAMLWAAAPAGPAAAQQPPGGGAAQLLVVQRFVVGPSEILTEEELAAVTGRYIGRPMPVDELYAMVAELDALYEAKGFVGRAVLPPQTIADGVVEVQLIEGRIHQIVVSGNDRTRTEFITKRLGLAPGDLVDLNKMADGLAVFNTAYDVALRAELRPGAEFGTTDYVVYAQEPKNDRFTFWIDNGGRFQTGEDRYAFSWTRASLLGYRDALGVSLSASRGTRSASLTYSVPAGLRGARVGASYTFSQLDIVEGPFEVAKLRNHLSNAQLNVQVPFGLTGRWPGSWSLSYHHQDSLMFWEGHELPETHKVTGAWEAGVRAATVAGASQWDFGYTLRSVSDQQEGKSYTIHRLSASWRRPVWAGVLQAGVSGQLSDGVLLPQAEQYSIGGSESVRGYQAGQGLGDAGYNVYLAYSVPLTARMEGTLHIDHGGVYPYKGDDQPVSEEDFLTSAAVSVSARLTDLLSLRMQWGFPLDAHAAGLGNTFYFRLQAAF